VVNAIDGGLIKDPKRIFTAMGVTANRVFNHCIIRKKNEDLLNIIAAHGINIGLHDTGDTLVV
jgi:hypothetical protein